MKWILLAYAVSSFVTLVLYGYDKRQSVRQKRRIAERTLHLWELVGGWPGALLAQNLFRHKTQKGSFRRVFWAVGVLHLIGWGLWIYIHPPF